MDSHGNNANHVEEDAKGGSQLGGDVVWQVNTILEAIAFPNFMASNTQSSSQY